MLFLVGGYPLSSETLYHHTKCLVEKTIQIKARSASNRAQNTVTHLEAEEPAASVVVDVLEDV